MPAPSPALAHLRSCVARRTQSYPPDHPVVLEAKRDLAYEKLAEHAAKVVADWPEPTDEQLARIAALLRAGA
jgi:hypothetical protein